MVHKVDCFRNPSGVLGALRVNDGIQSVLNLARQCFSTVFTIPESLRTMSVRRRRKAVLVDTQKNSRLCSVHQYDPVSNIRGLSGFDGISLCMDGDIFCSGHERWLAEQMKQIIDPLGNGEIQMAFTDGSIC